MTGAVMSRAKSNKRTSKLIAAATRRAAIALEPLEGRRLLSAGDVIYGPAVADVHGFQFDYRVGITTQEDGKILVAGYVDSIATGRDIAVARYLATGGIDSSYADNGVAVMALA